MRLGAATIRVAVALATASVALIPSWAAPTTRISVPATLARSIPLRALSPLVHLDFPATHLAFSWKGKEGTGIRYRALEASGRWTRWRRAPESHDMESGDHHFSAVLSVDRAVAVRWQPMARRSRPADVALDYLNTLDGPRRVVEIPALAGGAAETPTIVTRAEWGANESLKRTSGGCARSFYPVQQLFVHHTAGSNFDTRPKATMRAIYWYHTVRRGWCDLGYNFVIAPDGTIFEGRWARRYAPWELHDSENRAGQAVAGAHVSGFNSGSVGISMMGNFSKVEVSPPARRSLAELLAWEADRHDLDPTGVHSYRNPETGASRRLPYIAGHRDAGYTECPGNLLYARLPEIRRDAAAVMGSGKTSSATTLEVAPSHVSYGDGATASGTLTDSQGAPLPAQPVTLYRRNGRGAWTIGARVTTGPDGSFSFSFVPEKTTALVAVYDGDTVHWGSSSPRARVLVRPDVTLTAEGGTPDVFGEYHYPAGTERVHLSGTVAPPRPGATVNVAVFEISEDGTRTLLERRPRVLSSDSRYRYGFPVPEPRTDRTFEAVATFVRDAQHAYSKSPPIRFHVD